MQQSYYGFTGAPVFSAQSQSQENPGFRSQDSLRRVSSVSQARGSGLYPIIPSLTSGRTRAQKLFANESDDESEIEYISQPERPIHKRAASSRMIRSVEGATAIWPRAPSRSASLPTSSSSFSTTSSTSTGYRPHVADHSHTGSNLYRRLTTVARPGTDHPVHQQRQVPMVTHQAPDHQGRVRAVRIRGAPPAPRGPRAPIPPKTSIVDHFCLPYAGVTQAQNSHVPYSSVAQVQNQNPHVPYSSVTLTQQQQHTSDAFAPDALPVHVYSLNVPQNPTVPPTYTSCLPPGAAPPLVQPMISQQETSYHQTQAVPVAHVSQQPPPQSNVIATQSQHIYHQPSAVQMQTPNSPQPQQSTHYFQLPQNVQQQEHSQPVAVQSPVIAISQNAYNPVPVAHVSQQQYIDLAPSQPQYVVPAPQQLQYVQHPHSTAMYVSPNVQPQTVPVQQTPAYVLVPAEGGKVQLVPLAPAPAPVQQTTTESSSAAQPLLYVQPVQPAQTAPSSLVGYVSPNGQVQMIPAQQIHNYPGVPIVETPLVNQVQQRGIMTQPVAPMLVPQATIAPSASILTAAQQPRYVQLALPPQPAPTVLTSNAVYMSPGSQPQIIPGPAQPIYAYAVIPQDQVQQASDVAKPASSTSPTTQTTTAKTTPVSTGLETKRDKNVAAAQQKVNHAKTVATAVKWGFKLYKIVTML